MYVHAHQNSTRMCCGIYLVNISASPPHMHDNNTIIIMHRYVTYLALYD